MPAITRGRHRGLCQPRDERRHRLRAAARGARLQARLQRVPAEPRLISVGAYQRGGDEQIDQAITLMPRLLDFLRQDMNEQVTLDDSLEACTRCSRRARWRRCAPAAARDAGRAARGLSSRDEIRPPQPIQQVASSRARGRQCLWRVPAPARGGRAAAGRARDLSRRIPAALPQPAAAGITVAQLLEYQAFSASCRRRCGIRRDRRAAPHGRGAADGAWTDRRTHTRAMDRAVENWRRPS